MIAKSGKVVLGGNTDKKDRYIQPTILESVSSNDPIMQEEVSLLLFHGLLDGVNHGTHSDFWACPSNFDGQYRSRSD